MESPEKDLRNGASRLFPFDELCCPDHSDNSLSTEIPDSIAVQRWFSPDAHPRKTSQSDRTHIPPYTSRPISRASKRSSSCESLQSESSSMMRLLSRQNPNLQLPPFESLGITASSQASVSVASTLNSGRPPLAVCDFSSSIATCPPLFSNASPENPLSHRFDPTLAFPPTPPAEIGAVKWNSDSDSAICDIKSSTQYIPSQFDNFTSMYSPSPNGNDPQAPESTAQSVGSNGSVQPPMENHLLANDDPKSWLKHGINLVVSALHISKTPGQAVQMVSQTLPCPPTDQSINSSPGSAFGSIVEEIQYRLQPEHSPYINIIHAMPPKFSLNNLPTSPPSTPNRFSPGDDYFNLTVFSSGVPVSAYSYHDSAWENLPSGTMRTPTPIVPPYSVHISIVERYLPPPSPREYRDLFSATGPSVLVDRLRELSPQGGSLVLIYPTRAGAHTFKNHYLGPILEPLLRQMVVVNELSADTGKLLGCMPAISEMEDFETMQNNILRLCQNLSQRKPTLDSVPTSSNRGSSFNMIYGRKGEIRMDSKSWIEWYIQQETPRARAILNGHWRTGYKIPSNHITSSGNQKSSNRDMPCPSLLQMLFQGLRSRSTANGTDLGPSLEVGVFVIRRSQ
ncbi:hypothetical protein GX48_04395 [Paracoccidioides brasiliensis]|nr:hypothetical protein GX48_04395 [Paracoccidioides brasiliensis]